MNTCDLLRYKNLLLSKRQEISAGKSVLPSIPAAGELRGDPIDMASGETEAATEIRSRQANEELLRDIEDALTRMRDDKYGLCNECGQAISKARLEAVPWTGWCRDCRQRPNSQT